MVRVLLYSEVPILAAGLTSVLDQAADFELSSVCGSLREARNTLAADPAQLLLMDVTPEDAPALLGELDRSLLERKIILWMHDIPPDLALHAMSMGVRGILRSTLGPELLLRCLCKVEQGELWFEKALVDDFLEARRAGLSGREVQLVRLLALGLKNKEIASILAITEGTVKVYLSRLFHKLGVKDRFELALYGLKNPKAGAFQFPRRLAPGRVKKGGATPPGAGGQGGAEGPG